MIVRKFTPNDLKRVFEIESMSFNQSYGIEMVQQLYEMGVGFLVAEEDGYVIGYVIFWIKYEDQGHIISIAVDKNYRRLGAGTQLLVKAISILSLLNIRAIYLEVNENNTGAVEFYKTFNFKIDRVVPGYYENGDGAIIMYIPLNGGKVSP
ncbi:MULTISPECIES: ribosomal protein S18-alanine N-acetyltransferase [Methanobrevibacter]|jgi:ribosomal-protein-alanine N-acetyltransferase|uniref:Mycothiol acetyltransferase n=1 Tax=Methanobrevibacter thaueri TaxID=190975 RepID=A0A315XM55_9EURY|nr:MULTISPECIES: ribosomal protein S18-alanine N-acetyltransferase [Methanobrevibacter]MBR2665847.1 ribosomal protein S18-alanine N-acetyltransferase [Methanobrevibacter sp.]MBR3156420.1 ribosomal protein S18-alanine N-acetyltransferase [Methanobrevibacter sp.]MBR3198378.1 ribosomal protein S18-alanine N-acetyltransferase [Methanobrevibacter sp.]MBR6927617.1 ribosomal protein S18-alanine N-acetyltransferase [Methanobrevibacter sp.]PWB86913.1 mycothiol acetyltransferase [Methanobrevibacter thau